jgi:hypothetical protein
MKLRAIAIVVGGSVLAGTIGGAQRRQIGYSDTPMLPGGHWHVHDGNRPQPAILTPGTTPGAPPSDAVILFDGHDLSQWESLKGGSAKWTVADGTLTVAASTGNIATKEAFGDCQLHVEWATPAPPRGEDQDRGNSGVFLMSRYEIQVLDSFENVTYPDGQAAAIYGQFPPLVNASRGPGAWQTYDILFTAPRFKGNAVDTPAYVTVLHNGIVVHNHTAIIGTTGHRILGSYSPHPPKAPLMLQDHEHPVRYRNIWIRPLKGYDETS